MNGACRLTAGNAQTATPYITTTCGPQVKQHALFRVTALSIADIVSRLHQVHHKLPCYTMLRCRAFFEAGMAWKAAGRPNMAFVMLNRFLDLADALEDPEADISQLENADFADTDVPFDVALPEGPYATEAAREEVCAQVPSWCTLAPRCVHCGHVSIVLRLPHLTAAASDAMLTLLLALQHRHNALLESC
jgi:hypothetical protein